MPKADELEVFAPSFTARIMRKQSWFTRWLSQACLLALLYGQEDTRLCCLDSLRTMGKRCRRRLFSVCAAAFCLEPVWARIVPPCLRGVCGGAVGRLRVGDGGCLDRKVGGF